MAKFVWVFPGQGEQRLGMLSSLVASSTAKDMIALATEQTGVDLLQLSEHGPIEELARTSICQPLIFTMSCALVYELRQHHKCEMPLAVVGHSLGEYSALYAAGIASFADLLPLVVSRAKAMERACRAAPGAMLALIGGNHAAIATLLEQQAGSIAIANINAPNQIVLSGPARELTDLAEYLQERQLVQRAIPLKVQGAFHSAAMNSAAEEVYRVAMQVAWQRSNIPIFLNVTGEQASDGMDWPKYLMQQMLSPVRWMASVEAAERLGPAGYLEIGPGNTLTALLRRCVSGKVLRCFGSLEKMESIFAEVSCSSV